MKLENELEYNKAVLEIDDLMDAPEDDQVAMARLDELVQAVVDYEEIHYPIPPASEEEMFEFFKDQGHEEDDARKLAKSHFEDKDKE